MPEATVSELVFRIEVYSSSDKSFALSLVSEAIAIADDVPSFGISVVK